MKTEKLLAELKARGILLEPHPTAVAVDYPRGTLTPEFRSEIAAHTNELRAFVKDGHLIKRILLSEFDGASVEMVADLVSTLNASKHPAARAALSRLLHAA
jgi:hypothetical protein